MTELQRLIRSDSSCTGTTVDFNSIWNTVGRVGEVVLKGRRNRVKALHQLACDLQRLYPLPDPGSMAIKSGSILPWAANAYRYWTSIEPLFPDDINL